MQVRLRDDERRSGRRFAIDTELCYMLRRGKTILATGTGRTVDMSSSGILVSSTQGLYISAEIELSIAWPACIDGKVPMQLCVIGQTVRVQRNLTGIRILKHEFRTGRIRERSSRAAGDLLPTTRATLSYSSAGSVYEIGAVKRG